LGDFPGLAEEDRHEGRDLKVTTDFREVVAGVVEGHLKFSDSRSLFAGFSPSEASKSRLALLRRPT